MRPAAIGRATIRRQAGEGSPSPWGEGRGEGNFCAPVHGPDMALHTLRAFGCRSAQQIPSLILNWPSAVAIVLDFKIVVIEQFCFEFKAMLELGKEGVAVDDLFDYCQI